MKGKCASGFMMAVVILALTRVGALAQGTASAFDALAQHLHERDWVSIATSVEDGRAETESCADRAAELLLLGHAGIALGEGSWAPMTFFVSCSDSTDLHQAWLTWTEAFCAEFFDSSTCALVRGDALARAGRHLDALREFDRGLAINPNDPLLLNARGVLRWILHTTDDESFEELGPGAVQDLTRAAREYNLVDSWANLGLIRLQEATNYDLAYALFDRAVELSPKNWLAINGRSVAAGAAGREWEYHRDTQLLQRNAELLLAWRDPSLRESEAVDFGARGQDSWRVAAGGSLGLGFMKFGSFGFDISRGGIDTGLRLGENAELGLEGVHETQGLRAWFALNYPQEWVREGS